MAMQKSYRVVEVEPGTAPKLAKRGSWYRYVISNRETSIVGRCCGSLEHVRRHAEDLAHSINHRTRSNTSMWAPRPRTKTS